MKINVMLHILSFFQIKEFRRTPEAFSTQLLYVTNNITPNYTSSHHISLFWKKKTAKSKKNELHSAA